MLIGQQQSLKHEKVATKAEKTTTTNKKATTPDHLSSSVFNLKNYLELKKMEREAKLVGSLPNSINPINVIVQMRPSPDDSREDESLRQLGELKRFKPAAEQKYSKKREENETEDMIGPLTR